jgi:hypothetical protein
VAEKFAACEMFHLHGQLRVAPLNVIHPQTLKRSPRRAKTLKLGKKLSTFITGKSDKCCSGIAQAL